MSQIKKNNHSNNYNETGISTSNKRIITKKERFMSVILNAVKLLRYSSFNYAVTKIVILYIALFKF